MNMGQQELQESEQRREATEWHLSSLRVARGPESGAPKVERAQEGRNSEITAMVLMKRGVEKVSFPEHKSREIVTTLISFGSFLGSVLVNSSGRVV